MDKDTLFKLFTQIQLKIDKASGSETFILCMAVGSGMGKKF